VYQYILRQIIISFSFFGQPKGPAILATVVGGIFLGSIFGQHFWAALFWGITVRLTFSQHLGRTFKLRKVNPKLTRALGSFFGQHSVQHFRAALFWQITVRLTLRKHLGRTFKLRKVNPKLTSALAVFFGPALTSIGSKQHFYLMHQS